jgi:preprotein translocase subunit Sss1
MAIIRRLAWFVGLWAAGVAAVGIVGFAIRLALHN